jgi:hypothetical protein
MAGTECYNEFMNNQNEAVDYTQPVAYDTNGQPLYAHPPVASATEDAVVEQTTTTTTVTPASTAVHMARAIDPEKQVISDATKLKHARSKQLFPTLNLTEGEYVVRAVRRHPIGLVLPLGVGVVLLSAAFTVLFNFDLFMSNFNYSQEAVSVNSVLFPLFAFIALVVLGMYIVYYIYVNNRFFLTNESVIQEIQTSLFHRKEQTVSLANIEDASYNQRGLVQQIFNYGSIRLSTQGDETTYRFTYVANPKDHIATLNNAVESFKNGRPIASD